MALRVADRVQETTTTSGTGPLTLNGAVPGFQDLSTGIGSGNTTYFVVYDPITFDWEVALGTVTVGASTTLSRDVVLSNSLGTTAHINLAGNQANVLVTYPAEKSVNLDASDNVTPLGTITSGVWNGSTIDVAHGGTGVTASSGPNSVVLRDANGNVTFNNFTAGAAGTVASAGTTILTAASARTQILTGSTTQTYQLPDATTLLLGQSFLFINLSSGILTVVDYASAVVETIPSGGVTQLGVLNNSTIAGTWGPYSFLPGSYNFNNSTATFNNAVISDAVWHGSPIQSSYGGTGLTSFGGADYALYSTSASTLVAGVLPTAAGGTGTAGGFYTYGVIFANGSGNLTQDYDFSFNTGSKTLYTYDLVTSNPTVHLGSNAGASLQGTNSVAIGFNAGQTTQGGGAVAVGEYAGNASQGASAVAIGGGAGSVGQLTEAIAIGLSSGVSGQGAYAIAIGSGTAFYSQGSKAVAIGYEAGNASQGTATISIGAGASKTASGTNSIILNATGADYSPTGNNKFYVKPVATLSSTNTLLTYNSVTGEIANSVDVYTDTSGNVGIGTGTISDRLVVNTTPGASDQQGIRLLNSGTIYGALYATGSSYSYAGVGANETWLYSGGRNLSIGPDGSYAIKFVTGTVERSRFSAAGGFSVGTTADPGAGAIYATGNITAYYSSDRRLKENIKDVDNALDKVCAIGAKTFDWTDEYIESRGGEDGYFVQKSDFGVVAQDVQEVFPQAVRTREDGTLAVDYEKLATLAFGAIKELVKRVEALEAK